MWAGAFLSWPPSSPALAAYQGFVLFDPSEHSSLAPSEHSCQTVAFLPACPSCEGMLGQAPSEPSGAGGQANCLQARLVGFSLAPLLNRTKLVTRGPCRTLLLALGQG